MIVSYFIYDIRTLLVCSMTCRSWCIAAVPHLHHSLTVDDIPVHDGKFSWPWPLQGLYKLGFLPFVKKFRIRLYFSRFTLGNHALGYFPAFTNLQELVIDRLQVPSFMQDIQRCFGHFAPTLRLLALVEPSGSCRQILYFIGLFPNLQDLNLCYNLCIIRRESTADAELKPLSTPPLRGRLTLTCFMREELMREMIELFGGLRFRYMDLFRVGCAQLLLGASAETLEVLRLYPMDFRRKELLSKQRGKEKAQVHDS